METKYNVDIEACTTLRHRRLFWYLILYYPTYVIDLNPLKIVLVPNN